MLVHTSLFVWQLLISMKMTVNAILSTRQTMPHAIFFLFTKMELKFKEQRFESIEEIQAELQGVMRF
jgi:hypothetical protein